jgi:protein-disulfide isomerase
MVIGLRTRAAVRRHLVIAGLLAGGTAVSAGQEPAPQLFVTGAVPDAGSGTLTISGGTFGPRPFVTLDLVPLDIRASTDTLILAVAPVEAIPAGEYLLTVSRGPAREENASLQVAFGAADLLRADAATKSQPGRDAAGMPARATPDRAALPSLPTGDGPAALVGDRAISIEDVDREWRRSDPSTYLRLVRELYEARARVVRAMVADELFAREATARGITVDALLKEEVPKRVIAMPDSAVTSLYLSLGGSTRGASLDQMRPALRAWLGQHSEPEIAKMVFVEELKKVSTRAEILLEAPRVQVERGAQDITLGTERASVEIVAFGDFQSAAYARLAQAFSKVRDTFGDGIRFVFKNLPASNPESVAAAEAAMCASAQDRFWPYHNALVASGGGRLMESATAIGLNFDAFSGCVERRDFRDVIRRAVEEGDRYGIRASPSFLVNGRLAPSPPAFLASYDYFKLLIEEELARLARGHRR